MERNMIPFVFVLGRPGSGKSELFVQAAAKLKELDCKWGRLDDVRELRAMVKSDTEHRFVKPNRNPDGISTGFTVIDRSVFSVVLQTLNNQAQSQKEDGKSLFIEFARSNYVESLEQNFSEDVLNQSLIVYLYTPLKVSVGRTQKRWQEKLRSDSMDHMVPKEILEEFYKTDDYKDLMENKKFKCIFIDNSNDDIQHFKEDINKLIGVIISGKVPDQSVVLCSKKSKLHASSSNSNVEKLDPIPEKEYEDPDPELMD